MADFWECSGIKGAQSICRYLQAALEMSKATVQSLEGQLQEEKEQKDWV